jgi:hypothetical protein
MPHVTLDPQTTVQVKASGIRVSPSLGCVNISCCACLETHMTNNRNTGVSNIPPMLELSIYLVDAVSGMLRPSFFTNTTQLLLPQPQAPRSDLSCRAPSR